MKKILLLLVMTYVIFYGSVEGAMSESFQKTIAYMNIPETNLYGYEINEKIYQQYNLIVYGSPTDVKDNSQRWKDVTNGKWQNASTGAKGEYRILGFNINGGYVNNQLFPDDYVSGKTPLEWNYIIIEDAMDSWNNTEKYQTKEQYQYMLNQKLTRKGITYDLTASDIGLNKARIEAYATWKTAGSIFTLKKDENGIIWEATFSVPPMAGNANLEAILNFENGTSYKVDEKEDTIVIPFEYGAEVKELSEYAQESDIQLISSEVEIQYELYDKLSNTSTTKIAKDSKIIIKKSDYANLNKVIIHVKNTSLLYTCFEGDAPIVAIKEVDLEVIFHQEEEFIKVKSINIQNTEDSIPPFIEKISLYRKTTKNSDKKVPLSIAKKTNQSFICAGQVLVVEAEVLNDPSSVRLYIEGDASIQRLDSLTRKLVYEDPKARNEDILFRSEKSLENAFKIPANMTYKDGVYRVEYIIPYMTKQTLHSWSTLREINGNGLDIDTNQLFSRICAPYKLKIMAKNDGGIVTESISLDVFERWDTIYNRDISRYVR